MSVIIIHFHMLAYYHLFFFFNDTATTEIYTLSLHDALPISRSPRQGRDPDPAVAVLAAAARLLLVLPLSLRPRLEGLAVGDLRLPDHGVHPELAGQPTDDDLEVALPQPPDQRLPHLPRILVLDRRILLVQLVQPVRELFLFAARLDFDRLGDHRLGEGDLGEHDRVVLGRERVVG